MTLTASDQTALGNLSSNEIAKIITSLGPNFVQARWLGQLNRYSKNTDKTVGSETAGATGRIARPKQLSQYIAASCFLHAADGWSYLGKSMLSLLRGDPHRSLHLAYYAELRAAMSLMATRGVGIFNGRNFIVLGANNVKSVGKGNRTHQFAWEASPDRGVESRRRFAHKGHLRGPFFSTRKASRKGHCAGC